MAIARVVDKAPCIGAILLKGKHVSDDKCLFVLFQQTIYVCNDQSLISGRKLSKIFQEFELQRLVRSYLKCIARRRLGKRGNNAILVLKKTHDVVGDFGIEEFALFLVIDNASGLDGLFWKRVPCLPSDKYANRFLLVLQP